MLHGVNSTSDFGGNLSTGVIGVAPVLFPTKQPQHVPQHGKTTTQAKAAATPVPSGPGR